MNLYLAEIKYETSYYEGKTEELQMIRLVRADSQEEAEGKAWHYIESKTEEYYKYYRTLSVDISSTIE